MHTSKPSPSLCTHNLTAFGLVAALFPPAQLAQQQASVEVRRAVTLVQLCHPTVVSQRLLRPAQPFQSHCPVVVGFHMPGIQLQGLGVVAYCLMVALLQWTSGMPVPT